MKLQRNYYYDNAKAILILLVVIGHFIEPIVSNKSYAKGLFIFIYLFHMPAFIFISGYFSKGEIKIQQLKKLTIKFLIPYVIVQIVFIKFTHIIGIRDYKYTLITPVYVYWYMFAMFVWNILLGAIRKLKIKPKYIIGITFIIGILVGYIDCISWKFSLSRIIVFFPYFILGYYCNNIDVKHIINSKIVSISILISIVFIIYTFNNYINVSWLYCAMSYKSLNFIGADGIIYRVVLYSVQLLTLLCFMRLIPSFKNYFTYIGSRTLTIYILHAFVVKFFVAYGFYNNVNKYKVGGLILFSILLVIILGNLNIKIYIYIYINSNATQQAEIE